jgi:hypothetical protein
MPAQGAGEVEDVPDLPAGVGVPPELRVLSPDEAVQAQEEEVEAAAVDSDRPLSVSSSRAAASPRPVLDRGLPAGLPRR